MPFHVQTSSSEYIHYLYSVTDQRIYVETQNNTAGGIPAQANSGEYYLINAAGNVVSIYNKANVNDATFYFYGADGRIGHYDTHLAKTTAYVKDYLGNTRITLTSADPANPVENVYDYLPYGDILKTHQTGQTNEKYLSTENERDLATGLDYRNARYSDPIVGRFLSVDPLENERIGWTPYNYCRNNPVNNIDPTGKLDDGIVAVWNEEKKDYDRITLNNKGGTSTHFVEYYGGVLDGRMMTFHTKTRTAEWRDISGYEISPTFVTATGRGALIDANWAVDILGVGIASALIKVGTKMAITLARSLEFSAAKVVGKALNGVDDVITNPSLLQGKSLSEVQTVLKNTQGRAEGTLTKGRSAGQGWTLRQLNSKGTDFTDLYIQYSPGSPRHFGGKPYWKVSSGNGGTQWFPAGQ